MFQWMEGSQLADAFICEVLGVERVLCKFTSSQSCCHQINLLSASCSKFRLQFVPKVQFCFVNLIFCVAFFSSKTSSVFELYASLSGYVIFEKLSSVWNWDISLLLTGTVLSMQKLLKSVIAGILLLRYPLQMSQSVHARKLCELSNGLL